MLQHPNRASAHWVHDGAWAGPTESKRKGAGVCAHGRIISRMLLIPDVEILRSTNFLLHLLEFQLEWQDCRCLLPSSRTSISLLYQNTKVHIDTFIAKTVIIQRV